MGKPIKTSGGPVVYSRGTPLTKEQEDRLLLLLGYDADDIEEFQENHLELVLNDVAVILGTYNGALDSLDNAPRPANYAHEINELRRKLYSTLQELVGTSAWIREAVESEAYQLGETERALGKAFDALGIAVQKYEGKESRGGKTNKAAKVVVNHLRLIFQEKYNAPESPEDYWDKTESVDNREKPDKQKAEAQFIKECLDIAQIPYPTKIEELFYKEGDSPEEALYLRQF